MADEAKRKKQMPKEAYAKFASEMVRYNLSARTQVGLVGTIGGLLIVNRQLAVRSVASPEGYVSIAVLFAIVFCLTRTVLQKHERAVLPVYDGFMSLILTIAIIRTHGSARIPTQRRSFEHVVADHIHENNKNAFRQSKSSLRRPAKWVPAPDVLEIQKNGCTFEKLYKRMGYCIRRNNRDAGNRLFAISRGSMRMKNRPSDLQNSRVSLSRL